VRGERSTLGWRQLVSLASGMLADFSPVRLDLGSQSVAVNFDPPLELSVTASLGFDFRSDAEISL